MVRSKKKLEGEEKDEISGLFGNKTHRVGYEARERERLKKIPEFPGLGNQVDVRLFIKIGEAGEGAGLGGEGSGFISGTG